MGDSGQWRLPVAGAHRLAGRAGPLVFVGGAGAFDAAGTIRHPSDLSAQIPGAMACAAAALASEGCALRDVVRLKVFYRPAAGVDEWAVFAAVCAAFESDAPLPPITVHPVPLQPFPGQEVQVQAIAQPDWRELDGVRLVAEEVPESRRSLVGRSHLTRGLRAGEFIAVSARTASDEEGRTLAEDGAAQSRVVMELLGATLARLGAGFQDAIKMEGYYFGTDLDEWAEMAAARAESFREPGPVATVVPCHALHPRGALTKVELLAMRDAWSGFDKYIPREDRWPERVWDWPIPVPYRQGIRLRDMIWTGGQVAFEPSTNSGVCIFPGDLAAQTDFTMRYIDDILAAFDRGPRALRLLVCYYAASGDEAEVAACTETVVSALAASIPGPLPPLTLVPQPHMHTDEMMVEMWGVAQA